jgi:succinate dehydrogenase/fumarate reductase flavoprotein subunit
MPTWYEHLRSRGGVPRWPYPVRYGEEIRTDTDVLVLGGGIAGCHAAINARRMGVRVAVVEKEATRWAGNGGAGVDHWLSACTNPCSRVSPEDYTRRVLEDCAGYDCGPLRYVNARESWDALLDCERMGMKIRDAEGEFAGSDFRDEKTGLLFAYDYRNRVDIRVFGHNVKPCLHGEMRRLGVDIHDRVMVTALLTEGGGGARGSGPARDARPARVIGAMGIDTRTGGFHVFRARAVILATGLPGRIWNFSTEFRSTFRDPNCTGDGLAAAWNAGAELTRLEESVPDSGAFAYISYAVGNAHNTWHGCSIVDSDGREVPWVDRDGREVKGIAGRFLPSEGQRFMLGHGLRVPPSRENHVPELAPDLPDRIRRRELRLPLYADLTRMPAHERRAIFGLMVGNEGRTRIPVYDTLTHAGFNPDTDLLQVPVMPPSTYGHANFWNGQTGPLWRMWGCGGVVADWDLRTSLEGLYAAGGAIFGAGAHSSAAASGRYAGRTAAAHARSAAAARIDEAQIAAEKARVYAPLANGDRGMGWKELNAGIGRVMQDFCGAYRTEGTLREGLRLLAEIREAEAARVSVANPHELMRVLECHSIITVGEAAMHASLIRRASSDQLDFHRLDYPEVDPPEWARLCTVRLTEAGIMPGELPFDYFLRPPNADTLEENYRRHCVPVEGGAS